MDETRQEAKPRFSTEYNTPPKRIVVTISKGLLVLLTTILCLFLGGYVLGRWQNPYGSRPCRMPCVWSSLQSYAGNHAGWYPQDGPTPLQSLQQLYPSYCPAELLAGISGPEKEAKKRLDEGGTLDESVSSWVYTPGYREDDWKLLSSLVPNAKYGLAFIWERQPGISIIGTRMRDRNSHAVGFVGIGYFQIAGDKWNEFLKEQETYREIILDYRKQHPATNEPPRKAQ